MEEKEGKPRIKEKPLVKANEEVVKEGANSL